MFYWNPQRLKELKEKGYKIKFYNYHPKLKDMTIEEIEATQNTSSPTTKESIWELFKSDNASAGLPAIGFPLSFNEVFRSIGKPVNFLNW